MSLQTTNALSTVVLNTLIHAAAVGWAANTGWAAVATLPIGALGGATFGAVRYLSRIPLAALGTKCLNTEHPQASSAAKTLAEALKFFGGYAAAWAVLAAAGFTLTLSHMASLSLVSMFTGIGVHLLLHCMGLNTAAAR